MHRDIDDYQIVIIGFIVNVQEKRLEAVKKAMTDGIAQMESDDRSFIYDPMNPVLPRRKGASVGRIWNYRLPEKWNWQEFIKKSVEMMCEEDYESHKLIVVAADALTVRDVYSIGMGVKWAERAEAECRFLFCLHDRGCESGVRQAIDSLPSCRAATTPDYGDVGALISDAYRRLNKGEYDDSGV